MSKARRVTRKGKMVGLLFVVPALASMFGCAGLTVTTDDYEPALTLTQRFGDKALMQDPVVKTPTAYGRLSWYCMSLFESSKKIKIFDSARSDSFKVYALKIADYFVAHKDDDNDGKTGWGKAEAFDAFQDGSVNPKWQEYAFTTGLVGMCLLDAYEASGNTTYLTTVQEAAYEFEKAYKVLPSTTGCYNCGYFWYSTNANDVNRYVKNTNVEMGVMFGRLAKITGDTSYKTKAVQVLNSENWEILEKNNLRYLGTLDPVYIENVDNHLAFEMWLLDELGHMYDNGSFQKAVNKISNFFWSGGCNSCTPDIKTDAGIRTACSLAHHEGSSKNRCDRAIQYYNSNGITPGADGFLGVVKPFKNFKSF